MENIWSYNGFYIIFSCIASYRGPGWIRIGTSWVLVEVSLWYPSNSSCLTSLGVDPTTSIRVAFGTSLAVILPTAISGALGHKRRGAVITRPLILMGISGLIAALIGGTIASNTPGIYLKIIFGFLFLYLQYGC